MKKLFSLTFFALFGALLILSSCDDDDANGGGSGTFSVTADKSSVAGAEGETAEVVVTWSAPAGAKSFTSSDTSATVPESVSGTSGSFTSTITFGSEDLLITYTLVDQNDDKKTVNVDVTVGSVVITDSDLQGGQTYDWTKDKEYILDGLVFLEEGGVLNIEAGTIIRAKATPTTGDNATSLIITRGAKINAEGTAEEPIIFTAELDDMEGGVLTKEDNGQWGGLLVLGKAPVHKGGNTEVQIEGVNSSESRGLYGGNVADDNSGVLKYVSIRYTGIGFAPGDELQGLTLGGVGSGTTIDYIDIFSSADDGIEIFGGTVNIRHISVAFSTDDDFDFDLGYRGNAQFLFSIMRNDNDGYDHAGEWDGASPDDAPLYSMPYVYNLTSIGPGADAGGRDKAFLMRENFAGHLVNSVLVDFPSKGLEVQDLGCAIDNSYAKIGSELYIKNNTWSNFNGATELGALVKITSKDGDDNPVTPCDADASDLIAHLTGNGNEAIATSILGGISRDQDGGLDPLPLSAEDVDGVAEYPNDWFENVSYRGAFDPEAGNWLAGWSTLSKLGYLSE